MFHTYIAIDSKFEEILENWKKGVKLWEMTFNEKLILSQKCSVHGVYEKDNGAVMQLESVKIFSIRKDPGYNDSLINQRKG